MIREYSSNYLQFGELLARLRLAAGYIKQKDLATALGITQQSVSRWEKGLARPRPKEIPVLERLVGAKVNELLLAAGYQPAPTDIHADIATSYDRPLPLSALSPETFESFCAAFLHRMYKLQGGTVQRYGGRGHTQRGIDMYATGPFGTHSFQCKRVNEFGAQKVHTVVAEQTFDANLKVLLLSSIASPSSRDAMAAHAGWELWDREDISRRFQDLPLVDQLDLVDRYFNGQRLDLLGIDEAGPIQSPEDFFKPFLISDRFFNHSWELVGRSDEISEVVKHIQDETVVLTSLIGAPGSGKSRVLREVTQRLAHSTPLHIRFVSPTEEVKAHHLDKLRDPQGAATLLVVDDSHEREDLGTMLRYAAIPENRTRLLLSLRPYGKEALRLQAADVSLSGPLVRFTNMHPQTLTQAKALAESVLGECNGPVIAAAEIARATYSTPLVTVLAAQLVAREGVPLELLGNAEEFRTYVLRSLQDVITVSLVTGQDVPRLSAILRVIALLQPIIPDDPSLLNILLNTEKIEQADASRLMRLLGEAGVLFKRGLRSRLAPDLLADEIICSNYLNEDGTANNRVTQVFDLAGADHLKNLFVNLGRLDWRLREGNTEDSALLTSLGPKLRWVDKYNNPHIEAVEAVAYYQPKFALNFAKRLIDEGHGDNSSVCNMVRYAAYTQDHVQEACLLLWKAGCNDTSALHQKPSHGIRILKELAEFQVNKPIEYVQEIVRFALGLLERPISLKSTYTPFSILEGALGTEMETSSYSHSTITITRYKLSLKEVQSVRNELTEALLNYLVEEPPRRAFLAAQTLAVALRGPMYGDRSDNAWEREHVKLLKKITLILNKFQIPSVVLVRIAQSISWHAFYGNSKTSVHAQAILVLLNRDLRTRLMRALIDGWGTETWALSKNHEREEHVKDCDILKLDLMSAYPESSRLFDELQECLDEIAVFAHEGYGSSFIFINELLTSVKGLATELLLRNNDDRAGRLKQFVGVALSAVVEVGDSSLVNEYVARSEGSSKVLAQLAEAYTRFEPSRPYTPEEIELFKRIFQSQDPSVLSYASHMSRQIAIRSPALALELICMADFEINERATHDMFMWLAGNKVIPEAYVEAKRNVLLSKLVVLKKVNDYWVHAFLVMSIKKEPPFVLSLVMARLIEANRREDWSYVPLSKDHKGIGLGLIEVEGGPRLLRNFLDLALEELKDLSSSNTWRFGETISGLCGNYSQVLLDLLLDWMSSETQAHAILVARVLREAQPTLIYEYSKFIQDILNAAELISQEAMEEIRSAISTAAHSGLRHGTPGEPFPEDLRMEQHCEHMLKLLSRSEPAFDLYDGLLKYARHAIARQRQSKQAYEDEDD
jgi:transcriptional regulator with XRE-family HTH domain